MTRRRARNLSPEERRLWSHVARHVKPMKGKMPPPEPEPDEEPAAPPARQVALKPAALPALPPQPKAPSLPPLAPVERKTLQALRRGRKDVDSVIDLHGMRQEEAHFALIGFLHRAQNSGHSVVLVITGKGGAAVSSGLYEERGVLRRIVPHWLRLPDLRSLVVGFEEASPQHGGSGALYVRLRRRRGAG
ncbi:Smr/MutS family protein [Microvirga guangxiensis]|uniref:DNA-nicking endonuclease, Smr domain n=1 Tax=Microvirga guangxiensis TaxID=549386 RepID=A0A1G5FZD7_9HYPH|nr:Smr/MutS family protein [Microvirga guangxiensis]SCY44564.1 DNA-nicking endonuclease, Smr domain [Microvirga guangxiensis]